MAFNVVKLIDPLQIVNIPSGLVPKGAYAAGTDYAVGDSVDYQGSSYVMFIDAAAGTVPTDTTKWQVIAGKGDTGAAGADSTVAGPQGDAATIAVGTVTTGAAGSSAAVTNSGSTSAAVFDITIPRGNTGAQGIQGETGLTGSAGANGVVQSVVAGSNITVDNTDPANPVVAGTASYTLPTAEATVLGGVKVGDRLSIAAGVLSADVQTTDISGKASLALDNLASVAINTSLISDTDSTDNLGSSAKYWANIYTDKIYLNATATLSGATGGQVTIVGNILDTTGVFAIGANATIGTTNKILVNQGSFNPSSADLIGLNVQVSNDAAFASKGVYGLNFVVSSWHGSGTANFLAGMSGSYNLFGDGTTAQGYGGYIYIQNFGVGTITAAKVLSSQVLNFSTGTITTGYGLFIDTPINSGGGTITTSYGIYLANQNVGTTKYSIYSVGGNNYFGGNVNTADVYSVDGTRVVSNRVVDARCDDAINSGDATTDGVIDSLRDAMIAHGLIAAA